MPPPAMLGVLPSSEDYGGRPRSRTLLPMNGVIQRTNGRQRRGAAAAVFTDAQRLEVSRGESCQASSDLL